MKTPITLIFILCSPLFIFAQETVEVKLNPRNSPDTEIFHVLKSERSTKHGPYKRISNYKKYALEEGFYKMGKKDSVWIEYSFWDGKILTRGKFTDGVPTGEWEYYEKDGVAQRYDYTTNTLTYSKLRERAKDTTLVVYNGKDSVKMKVDAPPEMLGGPYAWQRYLNKTLRYPQDAIDNNIMGTSIIGFKVNADGTISDFWIKKSSHKSLDAESIRVLKNSTLTWIPATVNGKPVTVSHHLPMVFRLEEG